MVFAMWVARPNVFSDVAATALCAARDDGCRNLRKIAHQQSRELQLPFELVQEYLCQNLHFHLGNEQLRGLDLFYQRATNLRLTPDAPNVILDDCPIKHS